MTTSAPDTRNEHSHGDTARAKPPQRRFFGRTTPNQMWYTDIFAFRLGGRNAYLIGLLDDCSRYVVGLDVFRSQTAERVKEVLSDQGR